MEHSTKLANAQDMKTRAYRAFGLLTPILFLLVSFSACEDPQPSTAVITVNDVDDEPVHNAKVRLYGKPSDTVYATKEVDVDEEKQTDTRGKAKFNFEEYYEDGQSGLMVLDIEVIKDSIQVEDYIEVVEGEESTKTVTLEP